MLLAPILTWLTYVGVFAVKIKDLDPELNSIFFYSMLFIFWTPIPPISLLPPPIQSFGDLRSKGCCPLAVSSHPRDGGRETGLCGSLLTHPPSWSVAMATASLAWNEPGGGVDGVGGGGLRVCGQREQGVSEREVERRVEGKGRWPEEKKKKKEERREMNRGRVFVLAG